MVWKPHIVLIAGLVALLCCALPAAQEAQPEQPEPAPVRLDPEEVERLTEAASQSKASEIASEDAAVAQQLRSILAAVDRFDGIRAEVRAGVVVLSGVAASSEAAEGAARVAEQIDGVLLVVNEVAAEKNLVRRLSAAWTAVANRLRDALGSLPILGVALVVLASFWLLARLLRDAGFLYRLMSERTLLQNLLRQTVFVVVLIAGLVAALRLVDAGAVIGTVLGAAGVVGIALGFAFRNIVENYLAGILLAIRQPFHARDYVEIGGSAGTVLRMNSSETILMDADGNHLRLPNAMVFNGKVVNYTRNPLRRFTVAVGVGTDVDLDAAQEIGVATLRRLNGVVEEPPPSARVAALADSSVLLELYGWVDQRSANFVKVASAAHRLIKSAYDEAAIDMPAPVYSVLLESPPADLPVRPPTAASPVTVPAGSAPEEIDVSVTDDLTRQVEKELAQTGEADLLTDPKTAPEDG
jgi:small-conductance mechanosensitive channel